jgi:nucleotide-binding universal stress UspA family protein
MTPTHQAPASKDIILVPTDFSEVCYNAILQAVDIAQVFGYEVCVLHIFDKESKSRLKKEGLPPETIQEKLNQISSQIREEEGFELNGISQEGSIFVDINEIARRLGAKLMVLGTHGKVGFQKLSGSFAMRIISNSDIPVIVVQKKRLVHGIRNILFPVSLSSEDRQKLNWTIQIAKTFSSTVHVLPKFESDPDLERKMIGIVFQIKTHFREKGIPLVDGLEKVKTSEFDKQIIDYAVLQEIDLILIMTESNSLFSSWEEKILFNQSQIPVMCINPREIAGLSVVWNRF